MSATQKGKSTKLLTKIEFFVRNLKHLAELSPEFVLMADNRVSIKVNEQVRRQKNSHNILLMLTFHRIPSKVIRCRKTYFRDTLYNKVLSSNLKFIVQKS